MKKNKKEFSAEQKEHILKMFVEKKSLTEIGKTFETTSTTIAARLDDWGIRKKQTEEERKKEEKRKVFEKYDSKKELIIELYLNEKKSLTYISSCFKLDIGMLVRKSIVTGKQIGRAHV